MTSNIIQAWTGHAHKASARPPSPLHVCQQCMAVSSGRLLLAHGWPTHSRHLLPTPICVHRPVKHCSTQTPKSPSHATNGLLQNPAVARQTNRPATLQQWANITAHMHPTRLSGCCESVSHLQVVEGLGEGLGQGAHGVALQLGAQLVQAGLAFAGDLDHILLALGNGSCRDTQPQQCNPAMCMNFVRGHR